MLFKMLLTFCYLLIIKILLLTFFSTSSINYVFIFPNEVKLLFNLRYIFNLDIYI